MLTHPLTPEQARAVAAEKPGEDEIAVGDRTRFSLSLPFSGWWALVCGVGLALGAIWGFHETAKREILSGVDQKISAIEKHYLTVEEYRRLREEDFKFWDSRLDELKDEIRRK